MLFDDNAGILLSKIGMTANLLGPKWIPATKYGRTVNAYREQAISFPIQTNK